MATTSYGTPYVQSSDLVSGWPNASLNVANRIDAVSYAGNGLNAQTGTTYTLVVGDAGKTVTLSNAAAVAVTLPQDSVANLPTGAVVNFYNLGAGIVTISAGAGATLQGGSLTVAQYGYAAVIKLSANTYGPYQSGNPGLVPITSTAVAATTVSINNCFTSNYENYLVVLRLSFNVAATLYIRLRASGTDDTTNNYVLGRYYVGAGQSQAAGSQNNVTSTYWASTFVGTNQQSSTVLNLGGPQAAINTTGTLLSGGEFLEIYGYKFAQATQFDGLTIYNGSASTMTGNIRVYGYKN